MSTPNPRTAVVVEKRIPAGGIDRIDVEGDTYHIVSANNEFELARTGTGFVPVQQGDGEILPEGQVFSRLDIRNPATNGETLVVFIYAGFGRRYQSRQSVMEPPTIARSIFSGNITATTTVDLGQLPQGGEVRRKGVVITNGSSELKIEVQDADGILCDVVQPGHSKFYPITDAFYMRNPHGVAVEAYAMGIFWRA